jgi:hypothetical protein
MFSFTFQIRFEYVGFEIFKSDTSLQLFDCRISNPIVGFEIFKSDTSFTWFLTKQDGSLTEPEKLKHVGKWKVFRQAQRFTDAQKRREEKRREEQTRGEKTRKEKRRRRDQ